MRAAALVIVAALAPLAFSPAGDALNTMTLAAAYVVMALGLNVVVGFAGLLDLGFVAFYAIGAYAAAYVASGYWSGGIHLDFLLVLLVAAAATTVAGVLIGLPTLRLRSDYIAVVTLAFGEIIGQVAANGHEIALFGGTLTAGPNNIGPIDPIDLPLLPPFGDLDLRPWYWFALALVTAAIGAAARLRDSRVGRAWIALREDEDAAAGAGIPIARTKLLAYATGAAFGGVAGAFLASYLSVVNAGQFGFSFSVFVFSMVVVGGLGSIRGVVVGAIVVSVITTTVLPHTLGSLPRRLGLDLDLAEITPGAYGLLMVLVVLLRPEGLVPAPRRLRAAAAAGRTPGPSPWPTA